MNELFNKPLIYLITKGEATAANFIQKKKEILDIIRIAAESGIPLVQIREKKLSARLLFELTSQAVKLTKSSETKLLVNDRADVALAADADGVHLASNSISAKVIRRSFPRDFVIGVSTHSAEEAKSAMKHGADFVVFGPVFATPGKDKLQGLERLQDVCERLKPFPVLAIGGIGMTNYQSVVSFGASGFAAIRSLNDPENLRRLGTEFRK